MDDFFAANQLNWANRVELHSTDSTGSYRVTEVVAGVPSGVDPVVEADRRKAIALALALAGRDEGDVVVVAGKGHESGQTARGVTVPFDDREVAREELARLGWSG